MGDYFKPMRRKFGVVTVLMACVFALGWTRSMSCFDAASFVKDKHTSVSFLSFRNCLYWQTAQVEDRDMLVKSKGKWLTWTSMPIKTVEQGMRSLPPVKWKFSGFAKHEQSESGFRMEVFVAPYASIVIPLTLLSAFLILSKPRKSTSNKTFEPIPAEGK